ncbi:uncharacterized protein [Rutidosis leptorrhynchoides]|uniref:uncharacterized protein n=1 Tax=Rutidosis leptorrhynchoides TaxID=125765 RepID=UPI003A99CE3F
MGDATTSDNPISKLDFGDPLFLHASDITSTPIITFKLLGTENFRVWKCAMTLALKTKNKFGFLDRSVKKHATDVALGNQWKRCNSVVLSWILGSISKELYLGQNGSTLSEYYHSLNTLWKQFDAMVEIPDNTDDLKAHHAMIKLMQFLMGLDDSYHSIRSNILTTDPLPSVKTAYSILSREESHRITSQHSIKKPLASAFNNKLTANQNNIVKRGPNPNLKCTKCQKIGHTVDRCFEIVGYPPNYKGKMVNNKINHNSSTSWNNNSNNKNYSSVSAVAESSSQGNMPFSDEQIVVLMSLINSKTSSCDPKANMAGTGSFFSYFAKINMADLSSGFSKPSWIIDSGANQHYTTNEHDLINVVDISDLNLAVEHPNGTLTKNFKIDDCVISLNLTLFDVLVVPDYLVNLMSVYKIARDSKKFIGFDEHACYIQDLPHKGVMGKTLGTGSVHGGLYVLGHPAEPVMQVLKESLGFGNDIISPCDVCHKAKQTREPFPLSDHVSTSIGELVHLDVWGPYKVTTREGFRFFLTVDDFSRAVWVFLLSNKNSTSSSHGGSSQDPNDDNHSDHGEGGDISSLRSQESDLLSSPGSAGLDHTSSDQKEAESELDNDTHDDGVTATPMMGPSSSNPSLITGNDNSEGNAVQVPSDDNLRKSTRESFLPKKFDDYKMTGKVKYGLERYLNHANLNHKNLSFTASLKKKN